MKALIVAAVPAASAPPAAGPVVLPGPAAAPPPAANGSSPTPANGAASG